MSSSISGSTLRVSGLSSGLDTESIVKSMLSASQAKLDKAKQNKTLLEWKKEAYEGVLTELNDFKSKYFSSSSYSTGLSISNSLTKLSTGNFSSSYVSVSTSSSSSAGTIYIDDIVSLASAAKVESSSSVSSAPTIDVNVSELSGLTGKSMIVSLDGKEKTITFNNTYNTADDVKTDLQSLLNSAFGEGKVTVTADGDSLSLAAQSGSALIIKDSGVEGSEASEVLTFTSGASNRLDKTSELSSTVLGSKIFTDSGTGSAVDEISFKINGVSFTFSSSATMQSIMDNINSSDANVKITYSDLSDKFSIASTETGVASDISFGDVSGNFFSSIIGEGVKTSGTDAVVKLSTNGSTDSGSMVTITRSSNTFDIEGTTLTLLGKASGTASEDISINLSYDSDTIVDKIKSFVEDYNSILSTINTLLNEKKYSDYAPLTEDEEDELTETQATKWTEKAKSGILQNDMYLKSIASELKESFLANITEIGSNEELGSCFADIGISSTSYSDQGKLTIDEEKLRNALAKDPNTVINMFTQKPNSTYSAYATDEQKTQRYNESGLFWRLSDIMTKNLSTTGVKGSLITLVGAPGDTYDGDSEYGLRISALGSKIEDMEDALKDEENGYWKKFTAMETALSKLNSQSSWITQMLSSSSSS